MNRIHNTDPNDIVSRCLRTNEASALELPEIQFALTFIAGHIDQELTVKQIADELGISRRTLELRFRTHLKCTVGNMLTRLRVAAACQLLEETELPASDISVDVGFASVSSMANALRRHVDMTATEIRKGHRAGRIQTAGLDHPQ
jgi:transcriptional regulator GlxA family with amidase domain